jgi:hypothetical protein
MQIADSQEFGKDEDEYLDNLRRLLKESNGKIVAIG